MVVKLATDVSTYRRATAPVGLTASNAAYRSGYSLCSLRSVLVRDTTWPVPASRILYHPPCSMGWMISPYAFPSTITRCPTSNRFALAGAKPADGCGFPAATAAAAVATRAANRPGREASLSRWFLVLDTMSPVPSRRTLYLRGER